MPAAPVVAVVVTHNRRQLLAECLAAIEAQSSPPDRIIVVDNASTDGTQDDLALRPGLDVVRLGRNTGGAGGFAAGLARALDQPCQAIWLLDDDTVPRPDALSELLRARVRYPGEVPAVLASRVVWVDGRDHPMNTPRLRPFTTRLERSRARAVDAFPIRSASFVSILVDAALVRERGLPEAAYFLWNDDFEYTTRLLRGRVGLRVPASVVVHKTASFGGTESDPGERFYYEVRNKAWLFTRSRSLSGPEKALYAGSTVVRWVRTMGVSRHRGVLLHGLARGLRDARRPPPSPEQVLSDARPTGARS